MCLCVDWYLKCVCASIHPLQVYLIVTFLQNSPEDYSAVHPFVVPLLVRAHTEYIHALGVHRRSFTLCPPPLLLPSLVCRPSRQLIGHLLVRVASPFQRAVKSNGLQFCGKIGIEVSLELKP